MSSRLGRLLLIVPVGAVACATVQVDRFAVHDARLGIVRAVVPKFESAWTSREEHHFALAIQRIVPAEDTMVFSKRSYDQGSTWVIDDESMEMISLVVPRSASRATYAIGRDSILAVYSAVNAGFPEMSCFGYAVSGTVTVDPVDEDRADVEISLHVRSEPREVIGAHCGDVDLSDSGRYQVLQVSELTPWLGGSPGDFTGYWGEPPDPVAPAPEVAP